jgi:hypothetical protein
LRSNRTNCEIKPVVLSLTIAVGNGQLVVAIGDVLRKSSYDQGAAGIADNHQRVNILTQGHHKRTCPIQQVRANDRNFYRIDRVIHGHLKNIYMTARRTRRRRCEGYRTCDKTCCDKQRRQYIFHPSLPKYTYWLRYIEARRTYLFFLFRRPGCLSLASSMLDN